MSKAKKLLEKAWPLMACLLVTALEALALESVFGWQWSRWMESFSFIKGTVSSYFGSGIAPTAPGSKGPDADAVSSFFRSFAFLWQASVGLMLNPHWLAEWWAGALGTVLTIAQILAFALMLRPVPAQAMSILGGQETRGEQTASTKALLAYRLAKKKAGDVVAKASGGMREFLSGRGGAFKPAWLLIAIAMSPFGPMALDLAFLYVVFLVLRDVRAAPSILLGSAATLVDALRSMGWLNVIWVSAVAFIILRKSALDTLRQMQESNYDMACSKAVAVLCLGQPGSGHSGMSISMMTDWQYHLRDQLMEDVHAAKWAFPIFPWERLEGWVARSAEEGELVTRAQVGEAVKALWIAFSEANFAKNKDGRELFFGYGGEGCQTSFFDGARTWSLKDAAASYACAYFMLYDGATLLSGNCSVKDSMAMLKSSYSLGGGPADYLAHGFRVPDPEEERGNGFCADFEFEEARIGVKMNAEAAAGKYHYDGGAVLWDEISLERGNARSHYGKDMNKDAKKTVATPDTDLLNWWVKLIRHQYMNAGRCIGKIFANTQREGATGIDLTSLFEEIYWIDSNSGEDNALPLWGADSLVCSWVQAHAEAWLDLWRNRERRDCLFNELLRDLARPFARHMARMRKSYGFESLSCQRSSGKSEDGGGTQTMASYYIIYRKMRAGTYNTDTFGALMKAPAMAAGEGHQQATHYQSLNPTMADYEKAKSYTVRQIQECNGDTFKEGSERLREILDYCSKGTAEPPK